jgi:intergrase/recombinase
MIQLDISESVADFIEGRVPTRIGAKHVWPWQGKQTRSMEDMMIALRSLDKRLGY